VITLRPGELATPRGEVFLLDHATGSMRPWANILPNDSADLMLLVRFITTPDGLTSVFAGRDPEHEWEWGKRTADGGR
jgi:hypothetical protein